MRSIVGYLTWFICCVLINEVPTIFGGNVVESLNWICEGEKAFYDVQRKNIQYVAVILSRFRLFYSLVQASQVKL